MSNQKSSFKEKLKALRQEYQELLPEKLKAIEANWRVACIGNEHQKNSLQLVHRETHSLAGSGSTFGFPALSAVSSEIEAFIKALQDDATPITAQHQATVDLLFERMNLAVAPGQQEKQEDDLDGTGPGESEGARLQTVFWLGLDKALAHDAARQLRFFGFRVTRFESWANLAENLKGQAVDILVFDLASPDGHFSEMGTVFAAFPSLPKNIAKICIVPEETDLIGQLEVIRAGADYCLRKPLALDQLLIQLDELVPFTLDRPYRLLIVDDDKPLSANTAAILGRAGMEVEVVNDPLDALQAFARFSPDLILMDLYMPNCSGLELARLIRQDRHNHGVPIVYLSGETEINQKLAALESGAEDFLLKPVKYRYLYRSLLARIKRSQHQRTAFSHDSLTGLHNHSAFYKELSHLIQATREKGETLILVLLDLDHFHLINETHGHLIGDRVLRTLSILLRRGFGRHALISRFGGDEFAIALPSMGMKRAGVLFDRLSNHFSRLNHWHDEKRFSVTLSGGLAELTPSDQPEDLIQAAAKGLYQAKCFGRNRVLAVDRVTSQETDTPAPEKDMGSSFIDDISLILDEELENSDSELEKGNLTFSESLKPFMGEKLALIEDDSPEQFIEDDDLETLEDGDEDEAAARSIVVVDDDRQVLTVITSFLEGEGFHVFAAGTGDEAYKLAREHHPQLMLIDLLLFPGIHGFELCKKVKADPQLTGVKIILMTAVYKDYRYRMEGQEAGGDAFVIKPLNFKELLEKIESLVPGKK